MVPHSSFSTALSSHSYIKQAKLVPQPEPNMYRLLVIVLFKPRFNLFLYIFISVILAKSLTRILLVHKVLITLFLTLKRHS